MRFRFKDTPNSAMSYLLHERQKYLDGPFMVLLEGNARTFAKMRHPFNDKEIPVTGQYRVRVRAAAEQGESDQPVFMDITRGSTGRLARFRVDATPQKPQIYEFTRTFDASVPGEYGVGIVGGTRFGSIVQERLRKMRKANDLFADGKLAESLQIKSRMRAQGDFDTNARGGFRPDVLDLAPFPKLMIEWIEVTGPLQPEFPPPSMTMLFPEGLPAEREQSIETIREIVARLLPRAFRRRVSKSEIDNIVQIAQAEKASGEPFEDILKTSITAILCSPNFLYLREDGTDKTRELKPIELATRLSYFLWSSKPDDELFSAAMSGELADDKVLEKQIDRMLADERSEGLVKGFARQWLKVDEFLRFEPDQAIFPDYYETQFAGIEDEITREPLEFFREVLHADEPVDAFLSSSWLMLNEKLAAYYGIEGVTGTDFRRVNLPSPMQWLDAARERSKNVPLLGDWYHLGPFSESDFDAAFETEHVNASKIDVEEGVKQKSWAKELRLRDGEVLDGLDAQNSAYYFYRRIDSAISQPLDLSLGSDDAIAVWVNGKSVLSEKVERPVQPDQHQLKIQLKKGRNDLLIKVVNATSSGGFYFQSEAVGGELAKAVLVKAKDRNVDHRRSLEAAFLKEAPAASRGGLLGMAGVHLWGADGNRTKPVERGKYLLTVLFNDPPPPPPPNAGEVEPNLRGQRLTVRERLEKHREQVTCNNCHRRIDPYGLAMENFNAIGLWRTHVDGEKPPNRYDERREVIDASGTLPNGKSFSNFIQFRRAILSQKERFHRGLTEKLLTYALGRTIEPSDRPVIDKILAQAAKEQTTLRSLIKAIARSEPFQTK